MINYALAHLFKEDSVDKQLKIVTDDNVVIDNTMISSERFTLDESICRSEALIFGSCEASSIQFQVNNVISSLKGKWLNVSVVLDGNTSTPFTIGRYKVETDTPTADRSWRDITAYDVMYDLINADVASWYNGLTFPMTLGNFRKSFLTYMNVQYEAQTLVNDSVSVEKTIDTTSISGKTILNAIGELNGVFGHINRSGKFEWKSLERQQEALLPSNTLYPKDNLYPSGTNAENYSGEYIKCTYEDFETSKITQISITQSSDEDDASVVIGSAGNTYKIRDNFILKGKEESAIRSIGQSILNTIDYVTYRPANVDAKGNPCVEVGDNILLNTSKQIIYSCVMSRQFKGVQALTDSLESRGTEVYTDDVNSQSNSIEDLKGKYSRLKHDIDGVSIEVGDLDTKTAASLKVNADAIAAEVSRAEGAESTLSSSISATASAISLKVSKTDIVSDLNNKMSGINITSDKIEVTSSGTFTVDANNFKLDSSGNAKATNMQIHNLYITPDGESQGIKISSGVDWAYNDLITVDSGFEAKGSLSSTGNISAPRYYEGNSGYYIDEKYATKTDISSFITGISVSDGGQSGKDKYSTALYWSSQSAGTKTSAIAYSIWLSDERKKKNIEDLQNIEKAYLNLRPVHFEFKEGVSGTDSHYHYGYLAQEVKKAFDDADINTYGTALVGYDEENDNWLLDKNELHALHTQMIQKLWKQNEEQQKEIDSLRSEIDKLKTLLKEKGVLNE